MKDNQKTCMAKGLHIKMPSLMLALLLVLQLSWTALATPEGALSINITNSTSNTPAPASTLNATAGNVSLLNIIGSTQTQSWQGFYGNISGNITLEDSANHSLYAWNDLSPDGEIYVSESQIDFSYGNIECYNFSKSAAGYLNITAYETSLGMSSDDTDGVNETFNTSSSYHSFYAGTTPINSQCPMTNLFNASGQENAGEFEEVLLYDKSSNKVIYTSLLESGGLAGFNNQVWDFEMLVAENGHSGDTSPTTYYFYVEIE